MIKLFEPFRPRIKLHIRQDFLQELWDKYVPVSSESYGNISLIYLKDIPEEADKGTRQVRVLVDLVLKNIFMQINVSQNPMLITQNVVSSSLRSTLNHYLAQLKRTDLQTFQSLNQYITYLKQAEEDNKRFEFWKSDSQILRQMEREYHILQHFSQSLRKLSSVRSFEIERRLGNDLLRSMKKTEYRIFAKNMVWQERQQIAEYIRSCGEAEYRQIVERLEREPVLYESVISESGQAVENKPTAENGLTAENKPAAENGPAAENRHAAENEPTAENRHAAENRPTIENGDISGNEYAASESEAKGAWENANVIPKELLLERIEEHFGQDEFWKFYHKVLFPEGMPVWEKNRKRMIHHLDQLSSEEIHYFWERIREQAAEVYDRQGTDFLKEETEQEKEDQESIGFFTTFYVKLEDMQKEYLLEMRESLQDIVKEVQTQDEAEILTRTMNLQTLLENSESAESSEMAWTVIEELQSFWKAVHQIERDVEYRLEEQKNRIVEREIEVLNHYQDILPTEEYTEKKFLLKYHDLHLSEEAVQKLWSWSRELLINTEDQSGEFIADEQQENREAILQDTIHVFEKNTDISKEKVVSDESVPVEYRTEFQKLIGQLNDYGKQHSFHIEYREGSIINEQVQELLINARKLDSEQYSLFIRVLSDMIQVRQQNAGEGLEKDFLQRFLQNTSTEVRSFYSEAERESAAILRQKELYDSEVEKIFRIYYGMQLEEDVVRKLQNWSEALRESSKLILQDRTVTELQKNQKTVLEDHAVTESQQNRKTVLEDHAVTQSQKAQEREVVLQNPSVRVSEESRAEIRAGLQKLIGQLNEYGEQNAYHIEYRESSLTNESIQELLVYARDLDPEQYSLFIKALSNMIEAQQAVQKRQGKNFAQIAGEGSLTEVWPLYSEIEGENTAIPQPEERYDYEVEKIFRTYYGGQLDEAVVQRLQNWSEALQESSKLNLQDRTVTELQQKTVLPDRTVTELQQKTVLQDRTVTELQKNQKTVLPDHAVAESQKVQERDIVLQNPSVRVSEESKAEFRTDFQKLIGQLNEYGEQNAYHIEYRESSLTNESIQELLVYARDLDSEQYSLFVRALSSMIEAQQAVQKRQEKNLAQIAGEAFLTEIRPFYSETEGENAAIPQPEQRYDYEVEKTFRTYYGKQLEKAVVRRLQNWSEALQEGSKLILQDHTVTGLQKNEKTVLQNRTVTELQKKQKTVLEDLAVTESQKAQEQEIVLLNPDMRVSEESRTEFRADLQKLIERLNEYGQRNTFHIEYIESSLTNESVQEMLKYVRQMDPSQYPLFIKALSDMIQAQQRVVLEWTARDFMQGHSLDASTEAQTFHLETEGDNPTIIQPEELRYRDVEKVFRSNYGTQLTAEAVRELQDWSEALQESSRPGQQENEELISERSQESTDFMEGDMQTEIIRQHIQQAKDRSELHQLIEQVKHYAGEAVRLEYREEQIRNPSIQKLIQHIRKLDEEDHRIFVSQLAKMIEVQQSMQAWENADQENSLPALQNRLADQEDSLPVLQNRLADQENRISGSEAPLEEQTLRFSHRISQRVYEIYPELSRRIREYEAWRKERYEAKIRHLMVYQSGNAFLFRPFRLNTEENYIAGQENAPESHLTRLNQGDITALHLTRLNQEDIVALHLTRPNQEDIATLHQTELGRENAPASYFISLGEAGKAEWNQNPRFIPGHQKYESQQELKHAALRSQTQPGRQEQEGRVQEERIQMKSAQAQMDVRLKQVEQQLKQVEIQTSRKEDVREAAEKIKKLLHEELHLEKLRRGMT